MKKNRIFRHVSPVAVVLILLVAGLPLVSCLIATGAGQEIDPIVIEKGQINTHESVLTAIDYRPEKRERSQPSVALVEQSKGMPPPRNWAVIVGVSDYLYGGDLEYCDDDAQDMYNRLTGAGWRPANIRLLKNSQATKSNIQSEISWMATNAGSQDLCLFFFSGHGGYSTDVSPIDEADSYDEYICPHDSLPYSWANDIRDDELDAWLSPIAARKVVILDTCHSGGFIRAAELTIKTRQAEESANLVDGFARDINKSGFVVLTASDDDESSYEDPFLQNGVFTYYVVQGLVGPADANGNGVSAEEAFAYAAPRAQAYTGYAQTPQLWDGIAGEVILTPHTLSVGSTDGGSVAEPGEGTFTYDPGTVVDLLAVPDIGYEFVNWTGNVGTVVNVNVADTTITMNGDYSITANFGTASCTLTTNATPPEGGSVSGGGTYDCSTTVEVEATPADECWYFNGWGGDLSGSVNPTSIHMDDDKTVIASFARYTYALATTADPPEGGSVSGNGTYECCTTVEVEAIPADECWYFNGWGGDLSGSVNPTSIHIDGNKTVTASFARHAYDLATTADPPEGGSVSGNGTYDCCTTVEVEAIPADECWYFTGWSGDLGGTENPTTIHIDGNKTVTANFAKYSYTLAGNATPAEGGSVSGNGTYDCCTTVEVEAIPADECWYFTGWSGDLGGTENPTTIHIDGNKTVTANFSPVPPSCRFWGTAQLDGADVPIGTTISALINGDTYTTTTPAVVWPGLESTYQLVVGSSGSDYAEGTVITFMIGNRTADQTATWVIGGNIELNLSAGEKPPPTIELNQGWNLISVPLIPNDSDLETMLAPVWGDFVRAFKYDRCTETWTS